MVHWTCAGYVTALLFSFSPEESLEKHCRNRNGVYASKPAIPTHKSHLNATSLQVKVRKKTKKQAKKGAMSKDWFWVKIFFLKIVSKSKNEKNENRKECTLNSFFSDSRFKLKLGVAHIASQVTLKFWASHLGKGSALIRWTTHDV